LIGAATVAENPVVLVPISCWVNICKQVANDGGCASPTAQNSSISALRPINCLKRLGGAPHKQVLSRHQAICRIALGGGWDECSRWMVFFDRCDRPTARNIAQLPTLLKLV